MNPIIAAGGILILIVGLLVVATDVPAIAGVMDSLPIVHWLAVIGSGMVVFGVTRSAFMTLIVAAAVAAALAMGWIPI